MKATLMHRVHQRRIRDVDHVFLGIEDVMRRIHVVVSLAADADGKHRRFLRHEGKGAERSEVEHALARQSRHPGNRARHRDAGHQPVKLSSEIGRIDLH